jgi:CheY-like chemotaxis protein
MSEPYQVWWVDDDDDRESDAEGLDEETDRIEVYFKSPEEVDELLQSVDEGSDIDLPDLILMDWFLNQQSDYEGTGLALEGRIRDTFPEIPVYGFSAQGHDPDFESRRGGDRFDNLLPHSSLLQGNAGEKLANHISSYHEIRNVKGEGAEALIELFNPPSNVRSEKLPSALPTEFKNGIPNGEEYEHGDVLRFGNWVRDEFLERPGLLWDEQLTATKLGLKKGAFEEYQDEFKNAIYDGIFEPQEGARWWKSDIIGILLELSDKADLEFESPWSSAPDILNVDESELAECVVCQEHYPETVAYRSPDSDQRSPVHFRCSEIKKSRDGVFDDLRILPRD